jgi:hypothetical protein
MIRVRPQEGEVARTGITLIAAREYRWAESRMREINPAVNSAKVAVFVCNFRCSRFVWGSQPWMLKRQRIEMADKPPSACCLDRGPTV